MSLYCQSDWHREVDEPDLANDPWRSAINRDYGRIIHSPGFRRLQGKTQVFPCAESDFFRNRLTHSLEVAQIAEGIAERLNFKYPQLRDDPVKERLCAAASLVHDIGHPPFGHNGERALDDAMRQFGGFEGNAQTLRILTRLEKKVRRPSPEAGDDRAGLNLCYRLLGAVLKYNKVIPLKRSKGAKLVKGYYASETGIVGRLKRATAGPLRKTMPEFKTIECQIMDLADDIAYSTFDLEDSLKAGFVTPASILASSANLLKEVARKVAKELGTKFSSTDVLATFAALFANLVAGQAKEDELMKLVRGYRGSQRLAESGYLRTKLSSQLIHEAINSVELQYDRNYPMLSKVRLATQARRRVEVLKQYTFVATVYSARVKLPEYRGYEVVKSIFKALKDDRSNLLLPDDVREHVSRYKHGSVKRMRVLCDFVAGMTDRYAVEFYGRLHSDGGQSMWKPL